MTQPNLRLPDRQPEPDTSGNLVVSVGDAISATYKVGDGAIVPVSPVVGGSITIPGFSADGSYTVIVTATDEAGNTATSTFTVVVDTTEPVLGSDTPTGTVTVVPAGGFTITATDNSNSVEVSYTVTGPSGSSVSGTGSGLVIIPASTFTAPGTYTITVTATDAAGNTAASTFTVSVAEVNVAPVLDPIGPHSVVAGQQLTFTAAASDANIPAQPLTFSLSGTVPAGASIDGSMGIFTWTPATAGSYTFDVVVSDGNGGTDSETITVTVTPSSPSVGSITATSAPAAARIFINNADTGFTTPHTFTSMPGGSYNVYVNKTGYLKPATQTKPVTSGQETKFDFSLTPDPAWYTFTGFDAPVDMSPVINSANAGKNIPLKWKLSDGNGYVSDPAKFALKIDSVACSAGSADPIEIYDPTTTTSDLKYQGNGAWHYNWKTEKAFAGKCMNVYLRYDNSLTSPVAKFKFK